MKTRAAMISVHERGSAGELGTLSAFREAFYGCLTRRADALFELCDAVLCAERAPDSLTSAYVRILRWRRCARTALTHPSIAGTCCRSSPSESSPGTVAGWFRSLEPTDGATSATRTFFPPPSACVAA